MGEIRAATGNAEVAHRELHLDDLESVRSFAADALPTGLRLLRARAVRPSERAADRVAASVRAPRQVP